MFIKLLIIGALLAILASLGQALFYLIKDRENSKRTVNALTKRITLSVALFIFLLIAQALGLITPHSL